MAGRVEHKRERYFLLSFRVYGLGFSIHKKKKREVYEDHFLLLLHKKGKEKEEEEEHFN